MGALTKAELSNGLAKAVGISKTDASDIVESFFDDIKAALESGQHVKLSGFGNFILRDKNPRPGRNPKTGEEVAISARRVVMFRAGHKLKERIEKKGR